MVTTRIKTISVGAAGYPAPTYQWFNTNGPINGATNSSYAINSAPLTANGASFYALAQNTVSNVTYAVTSSVVSLTIIADTNPPVLLGAQTLGLSQIQVTFSKLITSATASDTTNYSISGTNGIVALLCAGLAQARQLATECTLRSSKALREL